MVKYGRFSTLPSEIPLTKQKVQNKRTKKMAEKTTAKQEIKHGSEK